MSREKQGYYREYRTVRVWRSNMGLVANETSFQPWIQRALADVKVFIGGIVKVKDGIDTELTLTLEGFQKIEGDSFPLYPSVEIVNEGCAVDLKRKEAVICIQGDSSFVAFSVKTGSCKEITISKPEEKRADFEKRIRRMGYQIRETRVRGKRG